MPTKSVTFRRTRFPASVIASALAVVREIDPRATMSITQPSVSTGEVSWSFETWEEFLGALGQPYEAASLGISAPNMTGMSLSVMIRDASASVSVSCDTRADVERVMAVFEQSAELYRLPEPEPEPTPPLRVFIGHGGKSHAWRELKDHLRDLHHFEVIAYETGSRAGHSIRDVLESMLDQASFALIVMTAEDELADGEVRARQNVVHEAGLFQGRLGFARTLILLQEGVSAFSNIDGIQFVPFKDSIRETQGDVVAALYEAAHLTR